MLPIYDYQDKIIDTIRRNQVTIIVGETGSGKTTRLPLFLYEACFSTKGVIGITEPRKIAAMSVAKYVASELGTPLGKDVGYKVRFDDQTNRGTKILFMTDGILLRELHDDPNLRKYSVIMIDEAHERSVNIDFTLGLVKQLLGRRPDLKLIVSSATIDAQKFSEYFDDAPVIEVSGRTYPVKVHYADRDYDESYDWNQSAMIGAVVERVLNIHADKPAGDILVFMTGQDDITTLVKKFEVLCDPTMAFPIHDLVVLPAHGGLPADEQQLIFRSYPGKRKVIVATNIAETSITIDGVVYVVDSGLVKQTNFDSERGLGSLSVVRHSQSGCNQRLGRAGRTQPGVCYRMYTEDSFMNREEFTKPELLRTSLAATVLAMEAIGIEDIEEFDFLDAPDPEAFHEAYETLTALGAVEKGKVGLTAIGQAMSRLPLEPRMARMLLEADKHNCVLEVATIAAFFSVRNVFVRPKGKEREANDAHRHFQVSRSDALSFLKIWQEWEDVNFDRQWCFDNFLHLKSLEEMRSIRAQLLQILRQRGIELSSNQDMTAVRRSVVSGLVHNLFRHGSRYEYYGVLREDSYAYIHPGSAVFGQNPSWLVATEVVVTSKPYARGVSEVEVEWLPKIAPEYFRVSPVRELVSFTPGNDFALAKESIEMKQYGNWSTISNREVHVSLTEAQAIQEARIARAEASSEMIRLVFRETEGRFGSVMIARSSGVDYIGGHGSMTTGIRPGVIYYCETYGGGRAYPKFEVYDFTPPAPIEPVAKTEVKPQVKLEVKAAVVTKAAVKPAAPVKPAVVEPMAPKVAATDLAEQLRAKWGR